MNQTEEDAVFELHVPGFDAADLRRKVQAGVEAHRQEAIREGLDYDRLVDEPLPVDAIGDEVLEMAAQIQQIRRSADGLRLGPQVTDWHVPILNPLLNRFKDMLHALVLMYVNMLAGRQIAVNRALAGALLIVVNARQADTERIVALEQEVAALRKKLEAAD